MTPDPREMTPDPREMTPDPRGMIPDLREMTSDRREMSPDPREFNLRSQIAESLQSARLSSRILAKSIAAGFPSGPGRNTTYSSTYIPGGSAHTWRFTGVSL